MTSIIKVNELQDAGGNTIISSNGTGTFTSNLGGGITVAEKLIEDGYSAAALHGDLSQAQRDSVMNRFRERAIQILVATDVAARGIDVDDISHVINYNLPDEIENYTHRSGRTARAGKKGESLVLINTGEGYKIRQIEGKIRTTFVKGEIPEPKEICEAQLLKLVSKVIATEVKEDDIAEFLPPVMAEFENLTKEEVVKRFISAEFNRFLDYYERAGDLNAKAGRDRDAGRDGDRGNRRDRGDRNDRGDRGDRRERAPRKEDANKTRFFVNLGQRDGLNPGGLLRVVCDSTGLQSSNVGKIDILASYSFFEADNDLADKIIKEVNGTEYEGHTVNVEVTTKKPSGGGNAGRRPSSGGGSRSFGGPRSGGSSRREGGGGSSHRGGGGSRRDSGSSPRRSEGGSQRSESGGSREGGFENRRRRN